MASIAFVGRLSALLCAALLLACPRSAQAQECNTTFLDALAGTPTSLFRKGIDLAGFADKLPSPSIGITVLVPENKAWGNFLLRQGFNILGSLGSIEDKLLSIVTYHILPQPLPSSAITATDESQAGEAQTLLSLLAGQPFPLKYWHLGPEDDNQILFKGLLDGTVAGVSEMPIQVCNSWVYIVDEVLLPGYDIGDVPKVQLPADNPFSPTAPAPSPANESPAAGGPAPAPGPAPESPSCNSTWQEAAKAQQGLSLLATIMGQGAIATALPGPGAGNTLFAPTDNAFFSMLTTLNLTITDALALGDKLLGVLQYQVSPGVVTPDALPKADSLPTLLGGDYRIGVSAAPDGKVTLSGLFPGNKANVTETLTVCSSQVYVIDSVLIPADSVAALPSPSKSQPSTGVPSTPAASPPPVTSPPPQAANGSSLEGWVSGAGNYAGCTVELVSAASPNTTTNGSGWFSLPCGSNDSGNSSSGCQAPGNLQIWVVRVPGGQGEGCADSTTGLPLLYSLELGTPTTGGSLAVNPVTTLLSTLLLLAQNDGDRTTLLSTISLDGIDANWQQLAELVAAQLDIPSRQDFLQGNLLQGAKSGSNASLAVQAASSQLQALVVIGSSALAGGQERGGGAALDADAIASAVYAALGDQMQTNTAGAPLDLSNATLIASILSDAQDTLQKITRDEPLQGDLPTAAAVPIALLNKLVLEAVAEAQQAGQQASRAASVLSRVAVVAQADVAPSARLLGQGKLSASNFTSQYNEDGLVKLIQTAELA